MSDAAARITRSRGELVAPDGAREPVLAEEITVTSGGMSVAQLWAFSEALAAAGAESTRVVSLVGPINSDRNALQCSWRQIIPSESADSNAHA